MDEVIRTRFEVTGPRQGAAEVDRLNRSIRQHADESDRARDAATELFRVEGKLGQALAKLGPEAIAVGAVIGGIATAAVGAGVAIAALAVGLQRLGAAGSEVERAGRGFDRVAGPETARRLAEVTNGLVRATEAQAAFARAAGGDATESQILRYFELVTNRAQALGQVVSEEVGRAGEALDDMSGPEVQRQLRDLEREFGTVDERLHSVGEAWTQVEVAASGVFDEFAESYATNDQLISQISAINAGLQAMGTNWGTIGTGLAMVSADAIRGAVSYVSAQAATLQLALRGLAYVAEATHHPSAGLLRSAERAIGQLVHAGSVALEAGREVPAPPPPGGHQGSQPRPPSGGGAGREDARAYYEERTTDLIASIREGYLAEKEMIDNALANITDLEAAREEALADAHEAAISRARERYEYEEALAAAAHDRELERLDALEIAEEARLERIRENIGAFNSYASAAAGLGGTLAGIFGTLASREEEGSKAAEEYAQIQGGILAAVSYVQAAIEIAAAIAAGASYQYGSMAEHIAASVAYIAAGTMALTDLGGSATRPSGSATGSSSGRYNEAHERDLEEKDRGGQVTIWTLGYGSAGLGRELRRSARSYDRSGLDDQMAGSGGWS